MHKPLSEPFSTGRNQLAMAGKSPQKKKNTLYVKIFVNLSSTLLLLFFLL